MRHLRPNMNDYAGKVVRTSGFITCIASIDHCAVEADRFSVGLRPFLYFYADALSSEERTEFYSKCRGTCFFSGIVSVEKVIGRTQLKPVEVTFRNQ
jgi:hypothetical protein